MPGKSDMETKRLNLRAGGEYELSSLGVDWKFLTDARITHDLNASPYPFVSASFDEVCAIHVLKYLDLPSYWISTAVSAFVDFSADFASRPWCFLVDRFDGIDTTFIYAKSESVYGV